MYVCVTSFLDHVALSLHVAGEYFATFRSGRTTTVYLLATAVVQLISRIFWSIILSLASST